jgi:hypothetical protein
MNFTSYKERPLPTYKHDSPKDTFLGYVKNSRQQITDLYAYERPDGVVEIITRSADHGAVIMVLSNDLSDDHLEIFHYILTLWEEYKEDDVCIEEKKSYITSDRNTFFLAKSAQKHQKQIQKVKKLRRLFGADNLSLSGVQKSLLAEMIVKRSDEVMSILNLEDIKIIPEKV